MKLECYSEMMTALSDLHWTHYIHTYQYTNEYKDTHNQTNSNTETETD